jgi:hypothetical protein
LYDAKSKRKWLFPQTNHPSLEQYSKIQETTKLLTTLMRGGSQPCGAQAQVCLFVCLFCLLRTWFAKENIVTSSKNPIFPLFVELSWGHHGTSLKTRKKRSFHGGHGTSLKTRKKEGLFVAFENKKFQSNQKKRKGVTPTKCVVV